MTLPVKTLRPAALRRAADNIERRLQGLRVHDRARQLMEIQVIALRRVAESPKLYDILSPDDCTADQVLAAITGRAWMSESERAASIELWLCCFRTLDADEA